MISIEEEYKHSLKIKKKRTSGIIIYFIGDKIYMSCGYKYLHIYQLTEIEDLAKDYFLLVYNNLQPNEYDKYLSQNIKKSVDKKEYRKMIMDNRRFINGKETKYGKILIIPIIKKLIINPNIFEDFKSNIYMYAFINKVRILVLKAYT